jgi:hypothetical protein
MENEIAERHRPPVRTPAQGFKGDHVFIEVSEEEDSVRGIRGVDKNPAGELLNKQHQAHGLVYT